MTFISTFISKHGLYVMLLIILNILSFLPPQVVFIFNNDASLDNWYVVNDGVMGGLSQGRLIITNDGIGTFSGFVSLDNYGGFTSVRYDCSIDQVNKHSYIILEVKGDQKNYQLRLKNKRSDWYSYKIDFQTSGEWEKIKIPLNELYPVFRGRTLDFPNFNGDEIEEFGFLISNKVEEDFKLEIKSIHLD